MISCILNYFRGGIVTHDVVKMDRYNTVQWNIDNTKDYKPTEYGGEVVTTLGREY